MPSGNPRPAPAPATDARGGKAAAPRESQRQPVIVIFEDLHWIDTETQAVLDRLMESLPTPASCCSSTTDPSTSTPGAARPTTPSSGSIRCPPRAPKRYSTPCWVTDRPSSRSRAMLIERTEGNPFFLEESVQTLVETQVLSGARAPIDSGDTPEGMTDPRDGAGDPRGTHRPARRPRRSASSRPQRSSGRTCHSRCSMRSRTAPRTSLAVGGSAHLQATEFLYETSLSPDPRVHLQARARPTRWRTPVSSRIVGARSTRGSSKRSRRSTPSA